MNTCPHCAQPLLDPLDNLADGACSSCGERLAPAAPAWVNVARIKNLAEAGFLSDELSGHGIDARVYQNDSFSEVRGGWGTTYLIQVPRDMAQQAAAQIRTYADEREEDDATDDFGFGATPAPAEMHYWRPVAVVVLAGVAGFVIGRQSSAPSVDRRPSRESLAAAVDKIGRPLVTEPAPGQARHRLWHDRAQQTWYLDTDQDNDGLFEGQQAFHSVGAW